MKQYIKAILAAVLCLFLMLSIADTRQMRYDTDFDQTAILAHIENLTANGPRSIADKAENQLALDYIAGTLEGFGLANGDTTAQPAYLIQEYVAEDTDYQNWELKNIIAHIPANAPAPTGEAVMFMGHIDSVPMGVGASDDGVAVAVMLEAIRHTLAQMDQGVEYANDLVFCFVNGEEYGLYGSEAFMEEFTGFSDITARIRFGINLESRGTTGTLIMFETAAKNLNTVRMFADINESVFTCSIATMIYDMMPNGTDFSNFKEHYQGMNFANITGGENYHTQNDSLENVGGSYLSQQAQVVDAIIDCLANYDLSTLYEAEESAVFFTWLNAGTMVYDHATVLILAAVLLAMLIANVLLHKKERRAKRTATAIASIAAGLALTAGVTYGCYYLFQYIAVLFGRIDIHMVGTITYSNTVIVVGIGLVALALTALTAGFAMKGLKLKARDLIRGFAYLHGVLGIAVSLALPDASYLFVFSGLMLLANELIVTLTKRDWNLDLLATALYLPIVMPVLVLATSALGLTMAWVFGLIFALGIFGAGVRFIQWGKRRGAMAVLAAAMVLFLGVSLAKPDASMNLQGKQNLAKLPFDDALVYTVDPYGRGEYRVYDLNALDALEDYAPELEWSGEYYAAPGTAEVGYAIESQADSNMLTVTRVREDALVYLTFENITAESFTIYDDTGAQTYPFGDSETYGMTIHSDCTVIVNGGSADVQYREVVRDCAPLIPDEVHDQRLHFNLWLLEEYRLGE